MYPSAPPDGFSITRFLPAPVEQVWEAWVDPDAMAIWWRPYRTVTLPEELQADVQVGGHYRYTVVNEVSGNRVVTGGIYQELDPPHRIAFTWGEPNADPDETPLVIVTLESAEQDTLMFFELQGASGAPGDHFYYDSWAQILDSLGEYLTTHLKDA